jgi:hypothetical protein
MSALNTKCRFKFTRFVDIVSGKALCLLCVACKVCRAPFNRISLTIGMCKRNAIGAEQYLDSQEALVITSISCFQLFATRVFSTAAQVRGTI